MICGCKGTNNISEIAPISLHIFILPPFFLIIHLLAPYRGWSLRSLVIKVIKLFRKWFKYGLKAQKLLAQGIALGIIAVCKTPCKGDKFASIITQGDALG